MKKCIFVVDVQKGFINDNTKFVINRIENLLRKDIFNLVISTRFRNLKNSPYQKILHWDRLMSYEEQVLNNIVKLSADYIIDKEIYTSVNKKTLGILKKNNIEKVFIAGIDTDCCVLKTAADLFENNIHPYVLSYYSASTGGEKSNNAGLTVLERLIGGDNIIREPINEKILDDLVKDK